MFRALNTLYNKVASTVNVGKMANFWANCDEVLFQKTVECFVRRPTNYVSAQCSQSISVLVLRHFHWSVFVNKSLLF